MRLEWLEDLIAVSETGSFQEAAARRRLTQSAFSRRIQHIEEQVGIELFDRTRKPVQLRPAMQQQRDQIVRLAKDLHALVADLRRGDRLATNRIVIASQHALTTALTPLILQRIHALHEDTHVRLRSANLDECFALLLSRQADIALVYRLPDESHPIGDGKLIFTFGFTTRKELKKVVVEDVTDATALALVDDAAATDGCHACAKAVTALANDLAGLIGAFHGRNPDVYAC